jgi:bifunctional N-acetylglucosamine-1-phosphate-uridyltransferase/glucosamine-1-phosphate-acetyltransferase GlmU-like protein
MVVGHGGDEVKASLTKRPRLQFVTQEQQLGQVTLLQARTHLEGKRTIVLLSGDVPLLTVASLRRCSIHMPKPRRCDRHHRAPATAVWLWTHRSHQRQDLEDRRGAIPPPREGPD